MGKGVVRPEELVRTVKRENELFRGNMHQDAHEFLGWLLNKIAEDVEELEKSMGKSEREEREERLGGLKRFGLGINDSGEAKTFVHKLFEGLLTNETRCLTCETVGFFTYGNEVLGN
jgi:ubiquitin C-terminal hydrolase